MSYTLRVPVVCYKTLGAGHPIDFIVDKGALPRSPVLPTKIPKGLRQSLPLIHCPPTPSLDKHQRWSRVRRAAVCCSALGAAWIVVWPASQFGLEPNKSNVKSMQSLHTLMSWVIRTAMTQTESFLAERLKGFSAWIRWLAAGDLQLWPSPKPITRMPLITAGGRPDIQRLFCGSIARTGTNRKALLRFARFSRALPPGGSEMMKKASLEFYQNVDPNPPKPEHPGLAMQFRKVARVVTKDKVGAIGLPDFTLSFAGCFERSQRHGGSGYFVRDELWTPMVQGTRYWSTMFMFEQGPVLGIPQHQPLPGNPSLSMEGLGRDIEGLRRTVYDHMAVSAFGENWHVASVLPKPPVNDHAVYIIPDRGGFKVRVVTAGPAVMQTLAHSVRKVFYKDILPSIPTRHSLKSGGVGKWLSSLTMPPKESWDELGDWVALSSDLKSATDLFPFYLVEAINEGVEDNLKPHQANSPGWAAWKSLTGPQRLFDGKSISQCGKITPCEYKGPRYGDDHLDCDESCLTLDRTSSGNLMGTAPSWVLLNMFNVSLFRIAWAIWSRRGLRRRLPRQLYRAVTQESLRDSGIWAKVSAEVSKIISEEGFNPFAYAGFRKFNALTILIGDDLGAQCPFAVAVLYEILVEMAGGQTSPGKHYVQPWTFGSYILVAEEAALIDSIGRSHHAPTETLRGISASSLQTDTRDERIRWAQIGDNLSNIIGQARGRVQRPLCSYAHGYYAGWRRMLQQNGLPVYLPTKLGGLGWPHPKGLRWAVDRLSDLTMKSYQVLRGFRQKPLRFATEISQVRTVWMVKHYASDFQALYSLLQKQLESVPESRNTDGSLAPLTLDRPIGLPNPGLASIPVVDFLDNMAAEGSSCRFLAEPFYISSTADWKSTMLLPWGFDKYAEVKQSAKRYKRKVRSLIGLRRGDYPFETNREIFHGYLLEDLKLLEDYRICLSSDVVLESFPNLKLDRGKRDCTTASNTGAAEPRPSLTAEPEEDWLLS